MEVVFRSIDKKFFIVDDNLTHQLKFNLNDNLPMLTLILIWIFLPANLSLMSSPVHL